MCVCNHLEKFEAVLAELRLAVEQVRVFLAHMEKAAAIVERQIEEQRVGTNLATLVTPNPK